MLFFGFIGSTEEKDGGILGFFVVLPFFIILFLIIMAFLILYNKEEKQENKKKRKKIVLVCPKCNTKNNTINSFCTKCHYVFTKEDKHNNKVLEENKDNDNDVENLKGKIELLIEEKKKKKIMKKL